MFDQVLVKLKPTKLLLGKGESLFFQGDHVVNLYFVKTGKVKLIRNTLEGGQMMMHAALPGETFAEASLFSKEYHCSAIAELESEIISYKKSEFLRDIEQNPAVMKKLLKIFSQQVRDLRAINEIKNIHSAKDRILAFIRNEMDENKEVNLNMSL